VARFLDIKQAVISRPIFFNPYGAADTSIYFVSTAFIMFSIATRARLVTRRAMAGQQTQARTVAMAAVMGAGSHASSSKKEGDISSAFVSLSGADRPPLPDRFRELKLSLVAGRERDVAASWKRLLRGLKEENEIIARTGPAIIPSVEFGDLGSWRDGKGMSEEVRAEVRRRGAVVVRGVVPEQEARGYKDEIEDYVRRNPGTKGTLSLQLSHKQLVAHLIL
jgi:hypothetical protein